MKYSKMVKNLEAAKRWWDQQNDAYKRAHKKPGSVKCGSVNKK